MAGPSGSSKAGSCSARRRFGLNTHTQRSSPLLQQVGAMRRWGVGCSQRFAGAEPCPARRLCAQHAAQVLVHGKAGNNNAPAARTRATCW